MIYISHSSYFPCRQKWKLFEKSFSYFSPSASSLWLVKFIFHLEISSEGDSSWDKKESIRLLRLLIVLVINLIKWNEISSRNGCRLSSLIKWIGQRRFLHFFFMSHQDHRRQKFFSDLIWNVFHFWNFPWACSGFKENFKISCSTFLCFQKNFFFNLSLVTWS